MAMLPLSSAMQSPCLSCGTIELSKLVVATHCTYGERVTSSMGRMNVKILVSGEVVNNATKGSYQNRRLEVLAASTSSLPVVKTPNKLSMYLFKTEKGGHVKVITEKKNNKYGVIVEVSSLQLSGSEDGLIMSWGISRSDSSSVMPLDSQNSGLASKSGSIIQTPLVKKAFNSLAIELEFEATLAPFYVSFLLKSPLDGNMENLEIRSHRKTNFCFPVGISSGYPAPLGLSYSADGSINFALFSRNAESVVLCLFDDTTKEKPALEIDLDPYVNRSGDIWHASMDSTMNFVSYGYRCVNGTQEKGDNFCTNLVLLDPYAKIIGENFLGQLSKEPTFDWSGDVRPCLPMEKLVVYRLNVMGFTKDKSSNLPNEIRGTFSGITEKLNYFKDLGVNAILLEPIVPFNVQDGPYFPCHFFSPMNLYGSMKSMKEMVKRLHANGIEVFLEVVFTHTAEGGALIEIDKQSYYCDKGSEELSTRKNSLNCNFPIVQQMILDSLRHWVIEFHVDGFCFINSSSMLLGFNGEILSRPPLIEAIAFDPILSKTKIIADSFDPHDNKAAKEIIRFPHWKRWAEINTKFCIDIRNYLRGEGLLSSLATRLCGSGDIFLNGRGPAFSFNSIARNFGLSLVDLVSFSKNELLASELSWNCGEEGATNKTTILERRLKQIRNFLFILFVSLGVPVLNMGDECGQSSGGSPEYKDRKPFNWNALGAGFGIQTTHFISFLSSLRTRRSDFFQKRNFLKEENIDWRGSNLSPPNWEDPTSKFLAMTLKADEEESDLFIAFNASDKPESVTIPIPKAEMEWLRLVDTALPYPGFFSMDGVPVPKQTAGSVVYEMGSHSCILFEARSASG